MTPPEIHPVDRLVRAHLDAEARTIDGDAMLRRIHPVSPSSRERPVRGSRLSWFVSGLAIAASVALMIAIGLPAPKIATAAELVSDAQSTHSTSRDRCYRLTVEIETGAIRMLDLPPIVRMSNVWTRGDQFYMETTPPNPKLPPLVWGQDSTGRVWVAMSPKAGLLFEPDEINEPVATACEMMSLRTVTLLSQMLADFDLSRTDAGRSGEPYRVEAVFKRDAGGPPPKICEVRLDLDPHSKEIRKAVLKRNIPMPLGGFHAITLTFDLIETADISADRYTLAGHLESGANIFDRRDPFRPMRTKFREDLIRRFSERIGRP